MPLHLLGKKSWNVYNPENIAKVKRDEAVAKAQTENKERHLRNDAAASRLRALRGEEELPPSYNASESGDKSSSCSRHHDTSRKRRRLAGEDDTDRDIRLARADANVESVKTNHVKIVDSRGHISLVPEAQRTKDEQHNSQHDDISTGMRFKDAAGYNADGKPWYVDKKVSQSYNSEVGRDVWGNEDPRRREREQQRMTSSDPLLAMKRGVKQLRENEKQRKEWLEQRERDLHEVERLAREHSKRRRRRNSDENSLEGFSLDASAHDRTESRGARDRDKRHGHRKHRHRSRSPDRQNRHHRHHRTSLDHTLEKE